MKTERQSKTFWTSPLCYPWCLPPGWAQKSVQTFFPFYSPGYHVKEIWTDNYAYRGAIWTVIAVCLLLFFLWYNMRHAIKGTTITSSFQLMSSIYRQLKKVWTFSCWVERANKRHCVSNCNLHILPWCLSFLQQGLGPWRLVLICPLPLKYSATLCTSCINGWDFK